MDDLKAAVQGLRNRVTGHAPPPVNRLSAALQHPLLQDTRVVTLLAGGLVLLFLLLVSRRGTSASTRTKPGGPPTVLLVGPSDGGKTSLFAKLVHGTYPQTHASIQTSSTLFSLTSPDEPDQTKQIRLVDLPGHPRLRDEAKQYLATCSGIVFVADVVGIVRNAGQVAEQLAPLLISLASHSHSSRLSEPTRVLLLAHKTDLLIRPAPAAVPSPPDLPPTTVQTATERLRSILTREMDRLKSARGSSGGRIEGMGKVSGGAVSFWARLFGGGGGTGGGGGGGGSGSGAGADADDVEEDETLLWGGKGPFRWEDVEGLDIEWAASGLGMVNVSKPGKEAPVLSSGADEGEDGNGLDAVRRFLWDC